MTYIAWRQEVPDEAYHVIGTVQGANPHRAVEELIHSRRAYVGDRVFLVGQLSAEEPFGGIHYELVPTGVVPQVIA
jgi:hypothetical protein